MNIQFHTENPSIHSAVRSFVKEWKNERSYFEVYTSGSTGKPKKIRIQKSYARASAQMTGKYLDFKRGMHALLCLSPETIAGKMMLVRAFEWELHLHVVSPSATPFESVDSSIDFVAMVPYQVQQTLESNPGAFRKGQHVIIGGGPVSSRLEAKIKKLPATCFHTFGMTETITHIALRNISKEKKSFELLENVSGSVQDGRLVISAPHLGIEQLVTNDCVTFENEREFTWLGRLDFVVNSGGVKIHPELVESQLASLLSTPFFTIGIDDEMLGQKLVLCVESQPFEISKNRMQALLPKYCVPKTVFFYDSFEYTQSDKINRLATLAKEAQYETAVL